MPGRSPREALDRGVDGMRAVLSCVTQVRLSTHNVSPLRIMAPFSLVLGNFDTTPLRGTARIGLSVECVARVVQTKSDESNAAFDFQIVRYTYRLATRDDSELLAFHWTPDADIRAEVTYPHLHIGRILTANQTALRPRDLHKAHIPTGIVPLGAIIRMAITEFGVTPLRSNFEEILRRPADARTVP